MSAIYNLQKGSFDLYTNRVAVKRAVCFLYTSLASQTSRDAGIAASRFANPVKPHLNRQSIRCRSRKASSHSPDPTNTNVELIRDKRCHGGGRLRAPRVYIFEEPSSQSHHPTHANLAVNMKSITTSLLAASAIQSAVLAAPAGQDEPLTKRLENGLGRTPALGYNNWVRNNITE
jgi:hypothetical protein